MRWTDEQRRILAHPLDQHAVVRAAPGAGKTTTLVGRVLASLHLGVSPQRLRVVMFNRSIQRTFEARLREEGVSGVRVSTFDALGLEVLRAAERRGLLSFPLEVVPEGTTTWAREIYRPFREDIDSPGEIADAVAFWKAHLVPPSRAAFPRNPALVKAYKAVEDRRLRGEVLRVAFEDMVYTAVGVLGRCPQILGPIDQVLVDEFQDVNPGRVALLQRLIQPHTAIMAVGDEDQAINEWCGAHPRYFADFAATFPSLPTAEYPLSRSFRFGPVLAQAATHLIGHNHHRLPRRIEGGGAEPGQVLELVDVPEAVRGLLKKGWKPAELAVLYRGRPQGAPVLASLAAARVPMITEDMGVLLRGRGPELALGYLRCATAAGPIPPEEAWPVLHAPDRYIQRELMFELLRGQGPRGLLPLLDQIDEESGLNRTAVRVIRRLARLLRNMARAATAAEALDLLLEEEDVEAQIRGWLRSEADQETAVAAFHALHALLRGLGCAPAGAADALAALDPRAGASVEDCVWVSTIHKAKGMEWPVVLLPGLLEGACPATQVGGVPGTLEHPDGVPQSPWMEQERRIFYVGLTRASQVAGLHTPDDAKSRFLAELRGVRPAPPSAALSLREQVRAVVSAREQPKPSAGGRSWSEEEDAALMEGWEDGSTVEDLADQLERSPRGVAARLVRLGLVTSRSEARRRV